MTEGEATPTDDADEVHPLVGHVVAERYRIDALLGEGGMGAVFRATHLSLDRPVAVKLLHPSLTDDEQVSKRFEREALAASKLDHPGCVQVIDFGTTGKGMKYLVMQFLDGKELRDLTGTPLPFEQAIDFGVQIFRALEHAHKRGLVHRDLKPENIFLVDDDDGEIAIKLVDFGIVKLLEAAGHEKLTRLGMAFGTPAYMSPEQAAGGTIDPRTDLYAVGILLYEMLTGDPPFEADEPGILLRMQILTEPPPLPDTVSAAVAAVVLKLLEKGAGDRYASAKEARLALMAAVEAKSEAPAAGDPEPASSPPEESGAAVVSPPVAPPVEASKAPVPVRSGSTVPGEESETSSSAEPDSVVPVRSGSTVPGEESGDSTSEPDPSVHVRSGGTVVAGASTAAGAVPSAAASVGHGAVPVPGAMDSTAMGHAGAHQSTASASMSHGAMHSASYDVLSASSAQVPSMALSGPMNISGPHTMSGAHGMVPPNAAKPRASRRNAIVLVVVGVLVAWGAIALLWMSSRGDGSAASGAAAGEKGD